MQIGAEFVEKKTYARYDWNQGHMSADNKGMMRKPCIFS